MKTAKYHLFMGYLAVLDYKFGSYLPTYHQIILFGSADVLSTYHI
jgi:hypothetical protein